MLKAFLDKYFSNLSKDVPDKTDVIYVDFASVKDNDTSKAEYYSLLGNTVDNVLKKKVVAKWEELGKPDCMTVRNNTFMKRCRVLNVIFASHENTEKAIETLKSVGKVAVPDTELLQALKDMHRDGKGKIISVLMKNKVVGVVVYAKSMDMYDGKLCNHIIDALPCVMYNVNVEEDETYNEAVNTTINTEEVAPASETFEIKECESIKEMDKLF